MAHIHEKIDFTVTPVVIHPDKTKVLLVNHPRYKKWLCVGGHVELDENPDQTLLREIKEETGLEVEVLDENPRIAGPGFKTLFRPRFVDIHEANSPHQHIGLIYFCLAKTGEFTLSGEHDEMAWFDRQELDTIRPLTTELVYFYCKTALEETTK